MIYDSHLSDPASILSTSEEVEKFDTQFRDVIANIKEEIDVDLLFGPGKKIGRYTILGLKGTGGQAYVFRALDEDLRRTVFIKLYKKNLSEKQKQRVLDEGRALAKVQSPYVAQCYGVEMNGEHPYLILEHCEGLALDKYVAGRELSKTRALQIALQIAEGIRNVHSAGLLHLDLKPGNVTVTEDRQIKIIDFGLAREIDEVTGEGISGTPSFMAPECANRKNELVGKQTDVFGIGAIYYYLLTGHPPFRGKAIEDVYENARLGAVVSPTEIANDVAPEENDLCLRCLAINLDDRIESAEEFIARGESIRRKQRPAASMVWMAGIIFSLVAIALLIWFLFLKTPNDSGRTTSSEINHTFAASPDAPHRQLALPQRQANQVFAMIRGGKEIDLPGGGFKLDYQISLAETEDAESGEEIELLPAGDRFELIKDQLINLTVSAETDCYAAVYGINWYDDSGFQLEPFFPDEVGQPAFELRKDSRPSVFPIDPNSLTGKTEYFLVVASTRPWTIGDLGDVDVVKPEIRGSKAVTAPEKTSLRLINYFIQEPAEEEQQEEPQPAYIQWREKSLAAENPKQREVANIEEAIKFCKKAIELCPKNDPEILQLHLVLARQKYRNTDMTGCRQTLIEALACAEENDLYETFETATILRRLGFIAVGWQQWDENDKWTRKAVELVRKLPRNEKTAGVRLETVLERVASLAYQKRFEEARELLEREESAMDDSISPFLRAQFYSKQSLVYRNEKNYELAIQSGRKAVDTMAEQVETDAAKENWWRDLSTFQAALAEVHLRNRDYAEANKLWESALEIQEKYNKGFLLGRSSIHANLGIVNNELGHRKAARQHFVDSIKLLHEATARNYLNMDELDGISFTTEIRNSLSGIIRTTDDSNAAELLDTYRLVFQLKGIVSRMMIARRSAFRSCDRATFESYQHSAQRLGNQVVSSVFSDIEQTETISMLLAKRNAIAADIAKKIGDAEFKSSYSLTDLVEDLPSDLVLVDVVKVKTITDGGYGRDGQTEYQAFIVSREEQRPELVVRRVNLGLVAEIDQAVDIWIAGARFAGAELAQKGAKPGKKMTPAKSPAQLSLIWQKIQPLLDSRKQVRIASDGKLALVPWPALSDSDGNAVVVNFEVSSVPDIQHVLHCLVTPVTSSTGLLAIAGVDFGPQRNKPGNDWVSLGTTIPESEQIADIVRPHGQVELLIGDAATKAEFETKSQGKQFIVLSTHGFAMNVSDEMEKLVGRNPFALTGLVFDGANKVDYPLPPDYVGDLPVFTGEDALNLDLNATELVVLSACDSGAGKAFDGEGILGIQRAMLWSGARSCLASRWQLEGKSATEFTTAYFKNLLDKNMTKAQALHTVQRDMHKRGIDPRFWASWDLLGDWR